MHKPSKNKNKCTKIYAWSNSNQFSANLFIVLIYRCAWKYLKRTYAVTKLMGQVYRSVQITANTTHRKLPESTTKSLQLIKTEIERKILCRSCTIITLYYYCWSGKSVPYVKVLWLLLFISEIIDRKLPIHCAIGVLLTDFQYTFILKIG